MTTSKLSQVIRHMSVAVQQQSGREDGLEMAMTDMKRSKQQKQLKVSKAGHVAATIGLAMVAASLTGCGLGTSTALGNGSSVGSLGRGGIGGKVFGGQQPVIGAKLQLYAVGSGSLGAASTALIPTADQVVYAGPGTNTGALSDTDGSFNITGDYTCPSPSPQVYLIAAGGTSQGTPGSNLNSAIALMVPLGDCTTLVANAATTNLNINELTTVAAVYALAPYMTDLSHVGAVAVNDTGLINTFGNFSNLVNASQGAVGGAALPAGAVLPATEINSLGDILAACINTPTSASTPCSQLTTATGATDTVGMTLALAKNPASPTLTALYTMATPQSPFQPTVSQQPADWTIAIKYNAGGTLAAPYNVAIDKTGNAWVTNTGGSAVTAFTPAGVATSYSGSGLAGPKGIAVDRTGGVWVANPSANSVVKLTVAGTTVTAGSAFTAGGLNGPVALALDSGGNAWVANLLGNSVTELTSAGAAAAGNGTTGFTASGTISGPSGIALDSTGNVYAANSGGGNVVKLTNTSASAGAGTTGTAATGSPFTDLALQGTSAVAIDASNNVFALGSTTGTVLSPAISQFTSGGVASTYSPVAPGVAGFYPGIFALGNGKLLLANSVTAGSLVLETVGATPAAVSYGSLSTPVGVAVDPSGDVWVADSGDNTVSVFIGLTTPVVTPLAASVGP